MKLRAGDSDSIVISYHRAQNIKHYLFSPLNSYVSSRKSSRKNKLDLEVQVNPDWDKVLTCSYEKGGGHIFTDTTSESSRVLVPDGVINSRVGLLYVLSDVDVFTPNNCETKWIGHLDSSANK